MARKAAPEMEGSTSVTVRFPKKIYDWLKNKSEKDRRSFNAQVLLELEKQMKKETPPSS